MSNASEERFLIDRGTDAKRGVANLLGRGIIRQSCLDTQQQRLLYYVIHKSGRPP